MQFMAHMHAMSKLEAAARLLELIQMRPVSEGIRVVAALGVADLLASGPRSANQLAESTGAAADSLRRVMRALSDFGIFSQHSPDAFGLGSLGEFLKRDVTGSLHCCALLSGGEKGTDVIRLFTDSVRTGESAVQLARGKNICEWLESDHERTQLFHSVMRSLATLHLAGLLEAYDFSYAASLVDIEKNLVDVLKRNPRRRGVLFDLPHAVRGRPANNGPSRVSRPLRSRELPKGATGKVHRLALKAMLDEMPR
jgi:hypothetical protein